MSAIRIGLAMGSRMQDADLAESPLPTAGADGARYRSMVESAPAYFYLAAVDASSTLYLSPQAEAMLGYSAQEWSADPEFWEKIVHPDDRERVLSEFAECAHGGN